MDYDNKSINNLAAKTLYKIILVGDANVGKSCLLSRYTKDEYKQNYNITIGVEFSSKTLEINNKAVKLQIWDTAGQEAFRSIIGSFYRNSQAVLLIYDISNLQSFKKIQNWLKEVNQYCPDRVILVLIGNKCDLKERQVSYQEGEDLKNQNKMNLFFELSAFTGDNINEAFYQTTKLIMELQNKSSHIVSQDNVVKFLDQEQQKSKCNSCIFC